MLLLSWLLEMAERKLRKRSAESVGEEYRLDNLDGVETYTLSPNSSVLDEAFSAFDEAMLGAIRDGGEDIDIHADDDFEEPID